MRPLPAAILVSVAGHALALGWLAWSGSVLGAPAPRPPPSEVLQAPATAAPEAIVLVLLDAQAIDAAGREPAAAAATNTTAGRRDEPSAGPARSPWLTMRRPAPPELHGLSQGVIPSLQPRSLDRCRLHWCWRFADRRRATNAIDT